MNWNKGFPPPENLLGSGASDTNNMAPAGPQIAVVVPAYRVSLQLPQVLAAIGSEVQRIYVVDDACPDNSGELAERSTRDSRIRVIRNPRNLGVGGATMEGYQAALRDGATVIVKIDGDGQMDPALITAFVKPILAGHADYCKGNRFFSIERVRTMPVVRLLGNAALSFVSKLSSGYWDLFDPTNGYTAIHRNVLLQLPLEKISRRYFFESDMLFRLGTLRAVVVDIPMVAKYGSEVSNLKIRSITSEFVLKHFINFLKRIFYNYYLRDLSIASFELPAGLLMLGFGILFGGHHWLHSISTGTLTPPGTVMLAALPTLVGIQLLLSFLNFDIRAVPSRPIHPLLTAISRVST